MTSDSAVKQDLIISAYKPTARASKSGSRSAAGNRGRCLGVCPSRTWSSCQCSLPKTGRAEVVAERQAYLLFDRMVAFHVQRGYAVPLSAAGVLCRSAAAVPGAGRDVLSAGSSREYDRRRLEVKEVEQLQLFVSDEKSAIQWVRQQLAEKPMTLSGLAAALHEGGSAGVGEARAAAGASDDP